MANIALSFVYAIFSTQLSPWAVYFIQTGGIALSNTQYGGSIRHMLLSCMSPTCITWNTNSQYCYSCLYAWGSPVGGPLLHAQWLITSLTYSMFTKNALEGNLVVPWTLSNTLLIITLGNFAAKIALDIPLNVSFIKRV